MLEAHEYANLFPMMTTVELEALSADIKDNGLRQPVVRYKGKILDGRNRLKACDLAGVEPTFTDHAGDDASALALVISLNVQRRDLMQAQKAIVAARALPLFEAVAKQRMAEGGKRKSKGLDGQSTPSLSRTDAAKTFKVGEKAVQQAKALLSDAPDLATQVEACALSLADAYSKLQTRRGEEESRQRLAQQKARDAEQTEHLREAISNGEMSLEEALEKTRQEAREEEEKQREDAQARQIWSESMLRAAKDIRDWVGDRTDEYLAWYTKAGEPGAEEISFTVAHVREMICQLNRVLKFAFKEEA